MPRNLSLPIRGKSALRPLDTARPPPNPPLGSTWPAADPQDRPHPTSPILPRMLVPKNVTACSDGSRRRLIRSLEHVQVQLSLSYSRRGDLEIFLTSPMGTRSTLVAIRPLDISGQGYNNWIFMSTHYWDEDPQGLWTLGLENKGYYFNTDPPDPSPRAEDSEIQQEQIYQQSRAYVAMNERLRQAGEALRQKFDGLRQAGQRLEQDISQVTSATS